MNKVVLAVAHVGKVLFKPFFPVKVYGPRNLPNTKCLVVGNHLSGWDPIMYTLWTKNIVSFVYKAEFQKSAFLRAVFNSLDCVPVKRGEVDLAATKLIMRLLQNNQTVCLFPEGTRNPEVDCLQEFRTGTALFSLKTHAPIRPFYIWDKTKFMRKNYMIIGDEFTLDEFYDLPINKETLSKATAVIQAKVDALRIRLNEILSQKGVKRRKRTLKEVDKTHAYNSKQKTLAKQQALKRAEMDSSPPSEDSE